MLFNNPISPDKIDRVIDLLDTFLGDTVLDAGCGTGEFLIRLVKATGASGLGLDLSEEAIEAASKSAEARLPDRTCAFRVADLQKEPLEPSRFGLAACIGSTHAFGSGGDAYPNTLAQLMTCVRPGGQILVGEGYWKQDPDPDYLALIGEPVGIYHSHQENISRAEEQGLLPLYATVSNEDEWDHFEWCHKMEMERLAANHPDDPEWAKRLKRSREWRNGYLKWGRETMGFGLYLFRTPTSSPP